MGKRAVRVNQFQLVWIERERDQNGGVEREAGQDVTSGQRPSAGEQSGPGRRACRRR